MSLRVLTVALFAFGIFAAAALLYQQKFAASSKPYAISKDDATRIALNQVDREPNRDASLFPDKESTAKLIHVTANGLAFMADDEKSPSADMWLYTKEHRFLQAYWNQHFWHVEVTTSGNDGYRGYYYLIDAKSGQVIGNDRDLAFFDLSATDP
jgi:uncharacterized protein YpmB